VFLQFQLLTRMQLFDQTCDWKCLCVFGGILQNSARMMLVASISGDQRI